MRKYLLVRVAAFPSILVSEEKRKGEFFPIERGKCPKWSGKALVFFLFRPAVFCSAFQRSGGQIALVPAPFFTDVLSARNNSSYLRTGFGKVGGKGNLPPKFMRNFSLQK